VGNPPTFDIETALGHRLSPLPPAAPDHLAVIRPPTAPRLTARSLASGPSTPCFRQWCRTHRAVTRKGRRPGFVGRRCLCRIEPSDTSSWLTGERTAWADRSPAQWPRVHQQHVNAAGLFEIGVWGAGCLRDP